jgi:hypothetical protein
VVALALVALALALVALLALVLLAVVLLAVVLLAGAVSGSGPRAGMRKERPRGTPPPLTSVLAPSPPGLRLPPRPTPTPTPGLGVGMVPCPCPCPCPSLPRPRGMDVDVDMGRWPSGGGCIWLIDCVRLLSWVEHVVYTSLQDTSGAEWNVWP